MSYDSDEKKYNLEEMAHLKYYDKYFIKNKIRQLKFDKQSMLDDVIKTYEILNSLHTRSLTTLSTLRLKISIFDHQIMAAKRVKNDFNGLALLADEVGLGKTIEAGILLKEYFVTGLVKNALILTPPSLVRQWQEEMLTKFDLDFIAQKDDDRFLGYDQHQMLIASLSSSVNPINELKLNSIEWDMVVVDEAHRLKNSNSKAHQLIENLQKKFLLLLSATPVQNNLKELYNIVGLIRPGLLDSWSNFSASYLIDDKGRTINPMKRNELQEKLSSVVIRTTRKEVKNYINFTDRIPKTHILESSDAEKNLYEKATSYVRSMWQNLGITSSMTQTFSLMILQRQIASSSAAIKTALNKKLQSTLNNREKIENLLILADKISVDTKMKNLLTVIKNEPGSKFLIFTEFIATQDYITENLFKNGFQTVKFNGEMSTYERDLSVNKFRRDIPIMVSTEAGGEGQNFQFCHNVINYDLPWNPMRVEQRIGRVHRIGQDHDVFIHNFAIADTIEQYVLQLLYEKINLFKMTIGDLDLLFGDEGMEKMQTQIFQSYMASNSKDDLKNKFSALGDGWTRERENLHEAVMEFDEEVFKNFDLSPLREIKNG